MKILFITHYSGMYGANLALIQSIIEMRTKYNITPIILTPQEGPLCNICTEKHIDYIVKYFKEAKTWIGQSRKNRILWAIKNIKNYWDIYKMTKPLQIDLIYSNTSIINIGAFLKFMTHKPHIWHIREFGIEDYQLDNIWGDKYERFVFNHLGDAFIAISQAIDEKYKKIIQPHLVHLIYDGIQTNNRTQYQASHNNPKLQLICVGALIHQKRQDTLIEMARILRYELYEENFILNIVGDGLPEYENQLKEMVKKYGLEHHIKFWGYQKDIPQILSQMNIGLTPSYKEAFGRVTVEYMLHNLLAIGMATGGTTEIIEDGKSGLLYTSTQQLAKIIKYMNSNRNILSSLAANGRKRANKLFSSERNSTEIYNICLTLFNNNI